MPAIIVCRCCGVSPEGFDSFDADAGIVPDDGCTGCGERDWAIWDVDPSELEGYDDEGELMNCPACDAELTHSECDEGECWDCGETW